MDVVDAVAQEVHLGIPKYSYLPGDVQVVLPQSFEDRCEVAYMLFVIAAVDDDV